MAEIGVGRIGTVSGRYYAMDRDRRWERTRKAYDAIVDGVGERAASAAEAVERAYADGVTDEFILPTVIDDGSGTAAIGPGDSAIFFNFRADRGRQLSEALVGRGVRRMGARATVAGLHLVTLVALRGGPGRGRSPFAPMDVTNPLARVVSEAGLAQLHTAETEKYAHVTFFFNGGREEPFPGESRVLIPSPKVATYDLQPEMSAPEVTDAVVGAIESGQYDFIIVNYANGDMVGHTGVFAAAVRADRDGRRLSGAGGGRHVGGGRRGAGHRRPRQRRGDDRPDNRRADDGAHDQSRAGGAGHAGASPAPQRPAPPGGATQRGGPDHPLPAWAATPGVDVGTIAASRVVAGCS